MDLLSDSEIVRLVKRGDRDAFRELIARHQRSAIALAYRMLARWDDAEDASQDAFVRAFRSIRSFREDALFWPWMRRIVVNCCIKRIPREEAVEDIESIANSEDNLVDSIESEFLRKCEQQDIRLAISTLPHQYRCVVILRYQEDLTAPEIAEALNISAGAVRVRLHRALAMLSKRLGVTTVEV